MIYEIKAVLRLHLALKGEYITHNEQINLPCTVAVKTACFQFWGVQSHAYIVYVLISGLNTVLNMGREPYKSAKLGSGHSFKCFGILPRCLQWLNPSKQIFGRTVTYCIAGYVREWKFSWKAGKGPKNYSSWLRYMRKDHGWCNVYFELGTRRANFGFDEKDGWV